jgi:hypothetical protein
MAETKKVLSWTIKLHKEEFYLFTKSKEGADEANCGSIKSCGTTNKINVKFFLHGITDPIVLLYLQ